MALHKCCTLAQGSSEWLPLLTLCSINQFASWHLNTTRHTRMLFSCATCPRLCAAGHAGAERCAVSQRRLDGGAGRPSALLEPPHGPNQVTKLQTPVPSWSSLEYSSTGIVTFLSCLVSRVAIPYQAGASRAPAAARPTGLVCGGAEGAAGSGCEQLQQPGAGAAESHDAARGAGAAGVDRAGRLRGLGVATAGQHSAACGKRPYGVWESAWSQTHSTLASAVLAYLSRMRTHLPLPTCPSRSI